MENNMKRFAPQGKSKLVDGTIAMPEQAGLRLVVVPASLSGKPEGITYDTLDKKWRNVKAEFKGWFAHHWDFKLGSLHSTFVQSDVCIVHMLCYTAKNELDAKGLELAVKNLSKQAVADKASVHMSFSALSMPNMEALIKVWLLEKGVNVYFYKDAVVVEPRTDDTGAVVMMAKEESAVEDVEAGADTEVNFVKFGDEAVATVDVKSVEVVSAPVTTPARKVKKVSKKLVKKINKSKTVKVAKPAVEQMAVEVPSTDSDAE